MRVMENSTSPKITIHVHIYIYNYTYLCYFSGSVLPSFNKLRSSPLFSLASRYDRQPHGAAVICNERNWYNFAIV